MVLCQDGEDVHVKVGGRKAVEYQIECKTEGVSQIITSYIEAKEGEEFKVQIRSLPVMSRGPCRLTLFVDGRFVSFTNRGCDPLSYDDTRMSYTGFRKGPTSSIVKRKAFTFGKVLTTSDNCIPKLSKEELEAACSIRLEIQPLQRISKKDHRHPFNRRGKKVPAVSTIHEDSKPALWGLNTVPGRTTVSTVGHTCYCKYEYDERKMKKVIVFKYRPIDWLRAQGIIADDSQQDVFLDRLQRIQRSNLPSDGTRSMPNDVDGSNVISDTMGTDQRICQDLHITRANTSASNIATVSAAQPSVFIDSIPQYRRAIIRRNTTTLGSVMIVRRSDGSTSRASRTTPTLEIQRAVAEALEMGRRQGRAEAEAEAEARQSNRHIPSEREASVKVETSARLPKRRFDTINLTLEDGQAMPRRRVIREAVVIED